MKTHNRILFHCLCCGRVVHAERETAVPKCCGQRMTNAAAETVTDSERDALCEDVCRAGHDEARPIVRPVPR